MNYACPRQGLCSSPTYFQTDHMLICKHDPELGWLDPEIKPYGPLELDPASTCLHYAPAYVSCRYAAAIPWSIEFAETRNFLESVSSKV